MSDVIRPDWLTGEAAAIFDRKVAVYRRRGQAVAGFESSLAAYCVIEARLIEAGRSGAAADPAMVEQHRAWAKQFFDPPLYPITGAATAAPVARGGTTCQP